jgi:NADPH2:quinone reductase
MRAVTVPRAGTPDVLVLADWPRPDPPGPGEVLMRVEAAGLNPSDCKIRGGRATLVGERAYPYVAGREAAGTVEAVGPEVRGFAPGDPVFAFFGWFARPGGHTERVAVPAGMVARRPAGVPVTEAAAVPLAGLTAWQALDRLEVPAGGTVVVLGASGGVGCLAVQLAAERGLDVVATAGPANHDFVRGLGARHVVDYHRPRHAEELRDAAGGAVRHLLDLVGPHAAAPLLPVLAADARLVGILQLGEGLPPGLSAEAIVARPDGAELAQLAARLEDGRLRATVQEVFPLERARDAHVLLETGHVRGKLVFVP